MADESGLFAAETTVLGVGNVILRDEGFGVRVAEYLAAHYDFPESVQIVDGGTLGIELTQFVTGTRRLRWFSLLSPVPASDQRSFWADLTMFSLIPITSKSRLTTMTAAL